MEKVNEQVQVRLDKLAKIKALGINPYPNDIVSDNEISDINKDYEQYTKEQLESDIHIVSVCGRIMSRRDMGKAAFITIKDNLDQIQCYVAQNNLTDMENEIFSLLDLGDFVYIKGEVMKTKIGAIAIRAKELKLVAKSITPLPEKFHGLTDVEERYRKRYIDLVVNDESKQVFINRSKIIASVRNYLNNHGYLEVETPTLQTIAGGAAAQPFITHHNTLDIDMYMRIAPELYLKRLIVGGFDKVYELGKQFRNEGISIKHNPEFTSIEIYTTYQEMHGVMDLCENLIKCAAQPLHPDLKLMYEDTEYDLNNFRKVHMVDLIKEVTGVDFWNVYDVNEAKALAKANNIELQPHHYELGHIINEFFEQRCEETLIQPTFVYGHPKDISPLARIDDNDPRFTQRFELFIGGREYANGFSELNDPIDQFQRFSAQVKERELGNDEATEIDYDFVNALAIGMPPTGGLGIGIDRLVMLLTNSVSIRDVILFPTMKTKK